MTRPIEEVRAHKERKAAQLEVRIRQEFIRVGLPANLHRQVEAARRRPEKPKKPTNYRWNPEDYPIDHDQQDRNATESERLENLRREQ